MDAVGELTAGAETGPVRVARQMIGALSSPTARALEMIVAVLSLFLAGYVLVAQVVLTNCLADYNERSSLASSARSQAYNQTTVADQVNTEAEDNLWSTVQHNAGLPAAEQKAAMQAAFKRFLSERARARTMRSTAAAYRAGHPLPEPPSQQCG
jgi:hypothetical protein